MKQYDDAEREKWSNGNWRDEVLILYSNIKYRAKFINLFPKFWTKRDGPWPQLKQSGQESNCHGKIRNQFNPTYVGLDQNPTSLRKTKLQAVRNRNHQTGSNLIGIVNCLGTPKGRYTPIVHERKDDILRYSVHFVSNSITHDWVDTLRGVKMFFGLYGKRSYG